MCSPQCGSNPPVVTPGEECDDGTKNGTGYGQCNELHSSDRYCGDGQTNSPRRPATTGSTTTPTPPTPRTSCAPGCVAPPQCGDNAVNAPYEACDLGSGNTANGYGGCTRECEIGPYCGDGATDTAHENSATTASTTASTGPATRTARRPRGAATASSTTSGARSATTAERHCMRAASSGRAAATARRAARARRGVRRRRQRRRLRRVRADRASTGPRCGDGVIQADEDEDCDLGEANDNGAYDGCTSTCKSGRTAATAAVNGARDLRRRCERRPATAAASRTAPGSGSAATATSTRSRASSARFRTRRPTAGENCRKGATVRQFGGAGRPRREVRRRRERRRLRPSAARAASTARAAATAWSTDDRAVRRRGRQQHRRGYGKCAPRLHLRAVLRRRRAAEPVRGVRRREQHERRRLQLGLQSTTTSLSSRPSRPDRGALRPRSHRWCRPAASPGGGGPAMGSQISKTAPLLGLAVGDLTAVLEHDPLRDREA